MLARSPDEEYRAATPLELFFDLCFVVAVAFAAGRLHHALAENHVGHGVLGYLTVFFAIWWAWMNFTWFASAYDTDDGPYRLATMVQMAGVLILAAGVPRAFDAGDFGVVTLGYVVMRLALVGQWLRAARGDTARRPTARRYAVGVTLVQIGWVLRLALPEGLLLPSFAALALAELAVPMWAERASPTPWHPGHIAERYGLFTIIVLGESILAATTAVRSALDAGHGVGALASLAAAGLVIVFSMWWLYFDRPAAERMLGALRTSFLWGYGHLAIFASAAAVGAGLQVAVDYDTGEAHLPALTAGFATAVPVAVFLIVTWLLHLRPGRRGAAALAFPITAVLVLATPLTHAPIHLIALLLAGLVTVTVLTRRPPEFGSSD